VYPSKTRAPFGGARKKNKNLNAKQLLPLLAAVQSRLALAAFRELLAPGFFFFKLFATRVGAASGLLGELVSVWHVLWRHQKRRPEELIVVVATNTSSFSSSSSSNPR
jgi:hypothetical protein